MKANSLIELAKELVKEFNPLNETVERFLERTAKKVVSTGVVTNKNITIFGQMIIPMLLNKEVKQ